MKRLILLSILACSAAFLSADEPSADRKAKQASGIHAANQRLGRGINLGNALEAPNEGEWGITLTEEDFKNVKEAGFDTVRLPVKWSNHAAKEAPYTIDETFAKRVDWAIDRATKQGLNVIVNVHHYNEMDEAPEEHTPRLVGLWKQIAERYKDRPDNVYFELLNEPHGKLDEATWNKILPLPLAEVRKTNPTRPVIVGPSQWNSVRAIDKLELPEDDNLIVTIHYYEPFHFTHQGASWAEGSDKWKGTTWTGKPEEKAAVHETFEKAAAWGKAHDKPIFLGEFGAYSAADMDSRAEWTRFVVDEAERLGFSFAYWELRSGFGAYDNEAKQWREPLKAALIQE
ncbi:MAG TPA: glycoside hydrolase family 5 protein [Pirellulaceae bacterium]|jgi:endoglucanase|nr:glycoside hydrolase family 5 protein [Pirellulaceae bacterium]